MAYKIQYKLSVARDFKRLDKQTATRILNKIEKELALHAHQYPALTGAFAGLRKLRVGDYRVIFSILGTDVLVLRVAHRKESYQ